MFGVQIIEINLVAGEHFMTCFFCIGLFIHGDQGPCPFGFAGPVMRVGTLHLQRTKKVSPSKLFMHLRWATDFACV